MCFALQLVIVFACLAIVSMAAAGVIPLAAPAVVAPVHATLVAQPWIARTVLAAPSGAVVATHSVPISLSGHVW